MSPSVRKEAMRLAVITPARNEADLLPGAIESMVRQTIQPVEWVIVDDGSSDETVAIAEEAAAEHPWIRVVRRGDRGRRVLGGGVIEAFDEGLAHVAADYDFVGKMDADLTFGPRYLERLDQLFRENPRMGAASGKVFRPEGDGYVEEFMIDEMVAGQWKLYRRECFEQIGGFVRAVMWDGIDFHRARQAGWETRSIDEADLRLLHHRLMGSSDRSVFRGRMRWGRGQWFMGSHPLYLIASAAFRMREKPYGIGGLLIASGYFAAMIRGDRRYEAPGFRRELRQWQMGRLRQLASSAVVR